AVVFVLGSLLCAVAPSGGTLFLVFVRIFLGLAVGAASALVPAYMSELAPARLRGRLSGLNQTMIVSGMLISYIVDLLLRELPRACACRVMAAAAAASGIILPLAVLSPPWSPRYLIKPGHEEQARRAVSSIRSADERDSEIELSRNNAEQEKN